MSDDDVYKLNFVAEKLSMTKADVIRKGIDELYKSLNKRNSVPYPQKQSTEPSQKTQG